MEKLKVKSGVNNQESSKKCSLTNDSEEILSADLDSRLTLKNTNGLLNGISPEEYTSCKIDSENESIVKQKVQVENQDIKTDEVVDAKLSNPLPPIEYVQYESELQMPMIMRIIQKDLSEPYSIYTYRYFIHNWPKLCFLAMCEGECVGAIVCKLDLHRKVIRRGYIAMLAVDEKFRKRSIGSTLVRRAIEEMIAGDADEVVLETEVTNKPALRLYEALGFVRDKRLFRYYLNGVDALRLKLWLR
ncbi:N(alpha)-acetyltransferase 30 A [Carabus blaptoides fortunei]